MPNAPFLTKEGGRGIGSIYLAREKDSESPLVKALPD